MSPKESNRNSRTIDFNSLRASIEMQNRALEEMEVDSGRNIQNQFALKIVEIESRDIKLPESIKVGPVDSFEPFVDEMVIMLPKNAEGKPELRLVSIQRAIFKEGITQAIPIPEEKQVTKVIRTLRSDEWLVWGAPAVNTLENFAVNAKKNSSPIPQKK
jgi:hypothetical protein